MPSRDRHDNDSSPCDSHRSRYSRRCARVRGHASAGSGAIDYLGGGQPLSEFLEDFPSVTREQAVAALRLAAQALVADARPA